MQKSKVNECYIRLFTDSQSPHCFQSDLFYILIELDQEFDHKSKFGLTWEVNLEENLFVNNGDISRIFHEIEIFYLHTLFEEIRGDKFVEEKKFVDLIIQEEILIWFVKKK